MPADLPDDDTCSARGCEEPTPWDMAAIVVDGVWYCSPPCAGSHLNRFGAPERVTLHDPQFHADREDLPHVEGDDVNISRHVRTVADADRAIEQATEMYPGAFRVEN